MKNKGITSIFATLTIMLCFMAGKTSPVFADETANTSTTATTAISPKVEITLVYQRQKGIASNQFAIWIEDASGRYIQTLYATRFTAKGGWKKRPESLPEWVKAAQPLKLSAKEIDAMTGATPSAGNLTYVWDCKDDKGIMVPAGEYRYLVEANLRWNSRVLYRGIINIGDPAQQSQATSEFFGDNEQEREMITNVVAKYYP
jgi:hypothetical protein